MGGLDGLHCKWQRRRAVRRGSSLADKNWISTRKRERKGDRISSFLCGHAAESKRTEKPSHFSNRNPVASCKQSKFVWRAQGMTFWRDRNYSKCGALIVGEPNWCSMSCDFDSLQFQLTYCEIHSASRFLRAARVTTQRQVAEKSGTRISAFGRNDFRRCVGRRWPCSRRGNSQW